MLLGNKKVEKDEKNWCVVLDTIVGQMGKNQMAQTLSKTFALSREEAQDVVANTPIIILDNLTRPVATKVKEYFNNSGANMILTNDLLRKRKYYRTVWPETPSLGFLHDWNATKPAAETPSESHEALAPDEALHEIRSITKQDPKPEIKKEQTIKPSTPPVTKVPDENLIVELDRRRQECANLRHEVIRLKQQVEKQELTKSEAQQSGLNLEREIEERDLQIKELRALLETSKERYDVLREETRQSRSIFDEKVHETRKGEEALRQKVVQLTHDVTRLEQEKEVLAKSLKEKQGLQQNIEQEWAGSKKDLEDRVAKLSLEVEKAQRNSDRLLFEQRDAQDIKATLENQVKQKDEELKGWQKRFYEHEDETRGFKAEHEALKDSKRLMDQRLTEIEESQLRLLKDFEKQAQSSREFQDRCEVLEAQITRLREESEDKNRMIEISGKQLEAREQEVHALKRELDESKRALADREAVHRREMIHIQQNEKESRLRRLVEEQQKIEEEVRLREDMIRKILTEQAKIEREILEDKQWLSPEKRDTYSSSSRLKIEKACDQDEKFESYSTKRDEERDT